MPTNTNQNPLDLNKKVFLKNKCTIPGFESIVVRARNTPDYDDGVSPQCYDTGFLCGGPGKSPGQCLCGADILGTLTQ